MRKEHKKKIKNVEYIVKEMPGIKALEVHTELLSLVGPSLISFISNPETLKETLKGDFKSGFNTEVITAIIGVLKELEPKRLNDFILKIFEDDVLIADKEGYPGELDFDKHFAGRITDIWPIIVFILQSNFNLGKLKE